MTWNYRAIKEISEGEEVYRVYEVYYDKDGQIDGWTQKPTYPQGETLDELRSSLIMMLRDVDNCPVLDMEELEKRFPGDKGEEGSSNQASPYPRCGAQTARWGSSCRSTYGSRIASHRAVGAWFLQTIGLRTLTFTSQSWRRCDCL